MVVCFPVSLIENSDLIGLTLKHTWKPTLRVFSTTEDTHSSCVCVCGGGREPESTKLSGLF